MLRYPICSTEKGFGQTDLDMLLYVLLRSSQTDGNFPNGTQSKDLWMFLTSL